MIPSDSASDDDKKLPETDNQFDARWALKFLPDAEKDLSSSIWRALWPSLAGIFYLAAPLIISVAIPSNIILVFGSPNPINLIQYLSIFFFALTVWRLRDVKYFYERVSSLHQQIRKVDSQ